MVRRVGRYEILEEIGHGGQSIAYKARDPKIDRMVTIKQVKTTTEMPVRERDNFYARFMREAQAAGRLSHPNIATIYDVGEDEEQVPYIAMEYVDGVTLSALIAEQFPLPANQIVDIFAELCSALEYAHQFEIIHRDVKPGNIMVARNNQVKVVDFGIAKLSSSELTEVGTVVGTPNYMSPEQITGQQLDRRSDIFSAGVVLYETLTGEKPFTGDNPTTIAFKIVHEPHRPALERVPTLLPGFDSILDKALAKDPRRRYPRCSAMEADLRALTRTVTEATLGGREESKTETNVKTQTLAIPVPEMSRPTSRGSAPGRAAAWRLPSFLQRWDRRAQVIASAGAALLLLSGLLYFSLGGSEPEAPDTTPVAEDTALPTKLPSRRDAVRPKPARPRRAPDRAATVRAGRRAFQAGNYRESIRILVRLVRQDPRNAPALHFLGRSYARQGRLSKAVENLSRAVKLQEKNPTYVIQLALALERKGSYAPALRSLERAIELGGDSEYSLPSLKARAGILRLRAGLAGLTPYRTAARHTHFLRGGCEGKLTITDTEIRYEPAKGGGHAFQGKIETIRTFRVKKNRLEVTLSQGKKYAFEVSDPERLAKIAVVLNRK